MMTSPYKVQSMTIEARYAASATGSIRIEMQAIASAVIWRWQINRRENSLHKFHNLGKFILL
jgi:hypothetical protein